MFAFHRPMTAPTTLRRPRVRSAAARLALSGLLALGAAGSSSAQSAQPDHVLWRNAKGAVNTVVGTVSENSLTQVVIDTGSAQRKLDALAVERIDFGAVPQAYADAVTYLARGDAENAAAKFTLAASDAEARPVVRARARLAAAEAWLRRAAIDRAAVESAARECELFLSEHPENRDVPRARLLLGRVQRLAGEPAKAAETCEALYREASGATATPGYPQSISFQAGLLAADAQLAEKNAAKARELYLALDGALGTALASLPETDPLRSVYTELQSEARLGEGFCLIASGSLAQAKTFFQGQLSGAEGNAVRRFGAHLGLGEVLLAEGNARAAQLEFAQVSALDHTNEQRAARALLGLAESALALGAKNDAKTWLEALQAQHGDTPAVLKAQELQKTL
jgi:thioredoxin-like negative regulator of GroEL